MAKKVSLCLITVLMMVGLLIAGCADKVDEGETGALLSEVVYTLEESHAAAVLQMQAGDLDIFAYGITDPDLFETVAADPNLQYHFNYGTYRDLRVNTVGPTFPATGELNPFWDPQIREAMNWLIDRDYVVGEYLGGLGAPKWTALGTVFPDHAIRYPHIVNAIEEYYAPNPEKAEQIITERMEELGAELVGGTWHYEGSPVVLRGLIRSDSAPNPAFGNYVSDLLVNIGFEVERSERTGAEASPIWLLGDPNDGAMHFYTGGWISSVIPRESGLIFDQMYTHRVMAYPLWAVLEEPLQDFPELDEAARKLRNMEFESLEEREQLMEIVLWEAMKFSNVIWVCDVAGANVFRSDVGVAVDVAGGIADPSWVFTAHRIVDGEPQYGATLNMALPNMLIDPWNPVSGSAWSYDMYFTRRAVGGAGVIPDPRDGLYWPLRIEKAEVFVKEGLPVDVTHDSWLTLEFVDDDIEVPLDAWADWDAANQKWITVGEKFGSGGTTALRMSVVHYPKDLYDIPLHDGSKLSIGDFVLSMIMRFDRAKEASPIYDEVTVAGLNAFLNTFKGVKIVSEDPLVIETYSDVWYMDAEEIIALVTSTWYPHYGTYAWNGYWHMVSVGILAETDKALTFSANKANALDVEQMDYTKGPSLDVLKSYMDQAAEDNYIPYAPVLGDYITAKEATERWSNIQAFFEENGHFWVGSGPYTFKSIHPVEKIVVLKQFEDYRDPAERFFFFLEPLAE